MRVKDIQTANQTQDKTTGHPRAVKATVRAAVKAATAEEVARAAIGKVNPVIQAVQAIVLETARTRAAAIAHQLREAIRTAAQVKADPVTGLLREAAKDAALIPSRPRREVHQRIVSQEARSRDRTAITAIRTKDASTTGVRADLTAAIIVEERVAEGATNSKISRRARKSTIRRRKLLSAER